MEYPYESDEDEVFLTAVDPLHQFSTGAASNGQAAPQQSTRLNATHHSFATVLPTLSADEKNKARGSADSAEAGPAPPLVPFVSPPPPAKLTTKHRYYSLARSENGTAHVMSDWEKKTILSRLRKCAPVDEEAFQRRLSQTRRRNEDAHINMVRRTVKERQEEAILETEERFLAQEERREQIFFRHRNLLQLKEVENYIIRAQSWYHIVVCHVFLTALIQERKAQEALETFSHLMAPMVKRYLALKRKRREAKELTQQQLGNIPFPYPQVIQSMYGTFFTGWPPLLLEKLVANATPAYLRKGSYLMHEGDIGRVMYMITTGTVTIILRKKGKDKRRTKDNSSGTFEVKAPCYVGEFALVCKEPRSASIYCETDIAYWAVRPEDYEEVAKLLSPEVASKQREATDVRRRQNLKKFFPLKVDFLRRFPYFELFSAESLEKIIACVEPLVLHDGDALFAAGQMDSSVYFIQDGIAIKRDEDGNESKVTTGSCVGMFECSCGVNEAKRSSIVSVNYCDVWRMKRETLIDVGMSEPVALLHCRRSATADRAREIRREPKTPPFLKNDPYLAFCLPVAYINKLYELATPVVYLNGEKITVMGQSVNSIVVLLGGAVDVTVANSGEQETFRLEVGEARARFGGGNGPSLSSAKAKEDAARTSTQTETSAQRNGSALKRASPRMSGKDPYLGRRTELSTTPTASAVTCVLGGYEFAASVAQYTYTVTSFGLTEAILIEKSKLDAVLPPDLRRIMHDEVGAREIVVKAHRHRALHLLAQHAERSFAHVYKVFREGERNKGRRRGHDTV